MGHCFNDLGMCWWKVSKDMPLQFGPRRGHSASTVFLFCSIASEIQGKAGYPWKTPGFHFLPCWGDLPALCCAAEGSPGESGAGMHSPCCEAPCSEV